MGLASRLWLQTSDEVRTSLPQPQALPVFPTPWQFVTLQYKIIRIGTLQVCWASSGYVLVETSKGC